MASGTQHDIEGLIAKALEIAERRARTLENLKAALLRGDDSKALELAREYCGIEHEESYRAGESIN